MKDLAWESADDATTTNADDHVILIAGDLVGTARTAAFAFAKAGNHIVVASDDDEAAVRLTAELRARNVDATYVHADTHNDREIQRLIDLTVQHYGHLDIEYR